jgi:hypothetical protein
MMWLFLRLALIGGLLLILGVAEVVQAQRRWVVINGSVQTSSELAVLDRYACRPIPNGSYWLDLESGRWGYAGDSRPIGPLSAACAGARGTRRSSLSSAASSSAPAPRPASAREGIFEVVK